MAYRELIMIEVREILRRVALGEGARPIAAAVGIDLLPCELLEGDASA